MDDHVDITLENVVPDLGPEDPSGDTSAAKETDFFAKGRAQLILVGIGQDLQERKKYAHRIFCLVAGWLVGMFILMVFQGFGKHLGFFLSDGVLLAAIGATTANVLGMLYVVANYLFPRRLVVEPKQDR